MLNETSENRAILLLLVTPFSTSISVAKNWLPFLGDETFESSPSKKFDFLFSFFSLWNSSRRVRKSVRFQTATFPNSSPFNIFSYPLFGLILPKKRRRCFALKAIQLTGNFSIRFVAESVTYSKERICLFLNLDDPMAKKTTFPSESHAHKQSKGSKKSTFLISTSL